MENDLHCYYSDLPSPAAYVKQEIADAKDVALTAIEIDRIIEMAWEDRTPFDAIEYQFGLKESEVKAIMKNALKLNSYKLWRTRVHHCSTKHTAKRSADIDRFKSSMQRTISHNKISKR
jgi:uncharacterized protein (TIGR03643 family)